MNIGTVVFRKRSNDLSKILAECVQDWVKLHLGETMTVEEAGHSLYELVEGLLPFPSRDSYYVEQYAGVSAECPNTAIIGFTHVKGLHITNWSVWLEIRTCKWHIWQNHQKIAEGVAI